MTFPCSTMACQAVTAAQGNVAPSSHRQRRRNLHHALLLQHHVFRQHAVDAAAEGAGLHIRGGLAAGPALEEAAGDLVTDLHAGDAGTHLDHLAGAVGQGDDIVAHRHPVCAAHDAEIAEVERARRDLDQHLAIGRLGIGALDLDQRVDAGAAFWQLIGTHVLSSPLYIDKLVAFCF